MREESFQILYLYLWYNIKIQSDFSADDPANALALGARRGGGGLATDFDGRALSQTGLCARAGFAPDTCSYLPVDYTLLYYINAICCLYPIRYLKLYCYIYIYLNVFLCIHFISYRFFYYVRSKNTLKKV